MDKERKRAITDQLGIDYKSINPNLVSSGYRIIARPHYKFAGRNYDHVLVQNLGKVSRDPFHMNSYHTHPLS
jgi:hypothetical protein